MYNKKIVKMNFIRKFFEKATCLFLISILSLSNCVLASEPTLSLKSDLLKQKIEETIKIFPWYAKLIDIDKINNVQDLPLMTPNVLEKYYYAHPLIGKYDVYQTSGTSTGVRKKIFYSSEDDQNYVKLRANLYNEFIPKGSMKSAFSDMGTGHAANTAREVFESMGLTFDCVSFDAPIEQHIEGLNKFKPDIFYTMPSILDNIVANSKNPKEYGIKKIILVGEIASKQWINQIAKTFEIEEKDILDTYGSIEIGTMATYNHDKGCYVIQEDLFAEGVKTEELPDNMETLPENESVLVLTSFVRSAFPAVRFVTNDVVRNLRTEVINGKPRQVFDCVVKRVGKEIKHGEKISLYDIENAVYKYLSKAEIRVEVSNNRLLVKIFSDELVPEMLTKIEESIQNSIDEIGIMIKNGILEKIQVISVAKDEIDNSSRKNKKLYYGEKFNDSKKMDWKKWEQLTDMDLNHTWRGKYFAQFVDNNDKTVMDLGCGNRFIEPFLPKGCKYIPVDYCSRGYSDMTICDFDKKEFPDKKADVIVLLSVLQWIDHPLWMIDEISQHVNKKILFHYITPLKSTDKEVIAKRESEGIKNHFPIPYIISQFNKHGLILSEKSRIRVKDNRFEADLVFEKTV